MDKEMTKMTVKIHCKANELMDKLKELENGMIEIYNDEKLCRSLLALRNGTPRVDPINGVLRLVRTTSDEWQCHECGYGDAEPLVRSSHQPDMLYGIGYRYCDHSHDYDDWKAGLNEDYEGGDPICCWCEDCDGCFWACPKCGHGNGVGCS